MHEVQRSEVHRPYKPVGPVVQDVDASGRLLHVAEECGLAGDRKRQDGAVDTAVQDEERGIPVRVV